MQFLDIAVILVYLIGVIWAGLSSRGKEGDSDDYFTAKGGFAGKLGIVMVGLSMAATLFSGISFVIYTSTAYTDGARIAVAVLGLPVSWLVLRFWFLPRYLAGSGTHPYDIIERRLGREVRLCVSAMFILLRIGWMAVMLVAPTLVLMGAAGLGSEWFWPIVILTGATCTLYTAIGGIRSVIVTDAIQFLVMGVGILFIIGFILVKVGLPVGDMFDQLQQSGRLNLWDFSFDPKESFTFWGVFFGLTAANLGSYMGDLMMLQRYLAAESPRAAARAFAINMWGVILVIIALVTTGLLLWVWYNNHPDPNLPAKTDHVLAYFIAQELPAGVSGLLIACILAATMSSMTSGIIALSGTLTNDWVQRFGRVRTQVELIRFGRISSVVIGLVAILAAGAASKAGTLFQISQAVLGGFLGPMLACMTIVAAGWKFRPRAVLVGMALGTLTGWIIAFSPIAVVWVAGGSAVVTLAVPLLAGRVAAPPATTHKR